VKNVIGFALIWVLLNIVMFARRWDGGRTPARQAARILLDVNLFVLGLLATVAGAAYAYARLR